MFKDIIGIFEFLVPKRFKKHAKNNLEEQGHTIVNEEETEEGINFITILFKNIFKS